MALTPAQKQKRYRDRQKARAVDVAELARAAIDEGVSALFAIAKRRGLATIGNIEDIFAFRRFLAAGPIANLEPIDGMRELMEMWRFGNAASERELQMLRRATDVISAVQLRDLPVGNGEGFGRPK